VDDDRGVTGVPDETTTAAVVDIVKTVEDDAVVVEVGNPETFDNITLLEDSLQVLT